jgi:ribosomal-protein-alanine N-acetyltransferase
MTEILSDRFLLRTLRPEDATERYLSWLKEENVLKHIITAKETNYITDLRGYIERRSERDDVLFLGIFEKESGVHIGNIKYEPIDLNKRYAIVGVLIGETDYRNKGVTPEVLKSSAAWIKANMGIDQIILGVAKDNEAAIRSYQKTGFKVAETPYITYTDNTIITMIWDL